MRTEDGRIINNRVDCGVGAAAPSCAFAPAKAGVVNPHEWPMALEHPAPDLVNGIAPVQH